MNDQTRRVMFDQGPQIDLASEYVASRWQVSPRVGIVLGTGLGGFGQQIRVADAIRYSEIPQFPASTAIGHHGSLLCGYLGEVPVLAMQGRFHIYEGYSAQLATLPIRVMRKLGIELLIVSNASGGLNPAYDSGDVMVIEDQINLMFRNPLVGSNDDCLGPRFPDMSAPYDSSLRNQALAVARQQGVHCHCGVYAALTGPTYETRAEYRMMRRLGADVVGMSTVPETLVAVHAGMRVLGLSAVTNLCRPDCLESTDGEAVKSAAERAEPSMRKIVEGIAEQL